MAKTKPEDISVEEKLKALFLLQQIDSKIDKIKVVRGELPLEVKDCEDVVEGIETRLNKLNDELANLEESISNKNNLIKDAKALIKKYQKQQENVRNNREYDSITKEMEYQNLEIQLAEKRIKESSFAIESKKEVVNEASTELDGKKKDLEFKQKELDEIISETEKDEKSLLKKSTSSESIIEARLLNAYKRIRSNVANGLGVVSVERGACGGCFNKIPPQRILDVSTHKKIIVCEHCGRILVDADILEGKAEKV
jgi:hypothetical protein